LGREAIAAWLARLGPRAVPAVAVAFAAMLALPAALEAALLLRDTQAGPRGSLALLHRSFPRADARLQPQRAPFCPAGRQPIPTHFSQKIYQRFAGPGREANTERMLRTFRRTPIKFIVQSFRLNQFPVELRRFWAENYQPYRASVFVAGRRLSGPRGAELDFEIVVPGAYRWLPAGGPHAIELEGRTLAAGRRVQLAPRPHPPPPPAAPPP